MSDERKAVENLVSGDECTHCGWMCEYEQSHIEYQNNWLGNSCPAMMLEYEITRDDDGEIIYRKKGTETRQIFI